MPLGMLVVIVGNDDAVVAFSNMLYFEYTTWDERSQNYTDIQ